MTKQKQIYKCNICGNIVEIMHEGKGQLVCCGQPMEVLTEKKEDLGKEKHVPIIEKSDDKFVVKIGLIPHPMEESHYIEWIEAIFENNSYKKFLKPGDIPEAEFKIKIGTNIISVRAYCNIHGLWTSS